MGFLLQCSSQLVCISAKGLEPVWSHLLQSCEAATSLSGCIAFIYLHIVALILWLQEPHHPHLLIPGASSPSSALSRSFIILIYCLHELHQPHLLSNYCLQELRYPHQLSPGAWVLRWLIKLYLEMYGTVQKSKAPSCFVEILFYIFIWWILHRVSGRKKKKEIYI